MDGMARSIIGAIGIALNAEFGDGYEAYDEETEQGLKEPCFMISCQSAERKPYPNRRKLCSHRLCIRYFPETENEQGECARVAERMHSCLEYVTEEGEIRPIRGTKMGHGMSGGILEFFVNYDFFARMAAEDDRMESIEAAAGVKEGG